MKSHKKFTKDYTVCPNEIHRHDLSLKAVGLYLYIINKPDGWNFSISGTASQVKDGRDSIRGAINELEKTGFLERAREQKEDGTLGNGIWNIYDAPHSGKTNVVNPYTGNATQVNTKEVNTNKERKVLSEKKTSDYMEGYQDQAFLNRKVANKKRKSGEKIPFGVRPWVKDAIDNAIDNISVIPSVTITQEYEDYCESLSSNRIIIPTPGGQVLWNKLLREGYKPAHIKCASRLAMYTSEDYWRDEFTPEGFFRRTTHEGKPVDYINKYMNTRANGDYKIIEIKQDMKNELSK